MEILKTKVRRRRKSKRLTSYYRTVDNRMNTSFGQPVHIRFYIQPLMDIDGNFNKEKIINLFNTECYG